MVGSGSNLGSAVLDLRADGKQLNRDLDNAEKRVNDRMERFSRRARAAGFIAAGVGAALTVPLALSVKTFAAFEQSMANVRAVSGATTEQFSGPDGHRPRRWARRPSSRRTRRPRRSRSCPWLAWSAEPVNRRVAVAY